MIHSVDEFKTHFESVRSGAGYKDPIAFGIARVDMGQKNQDKVLAASFAVVNYNESYLSAAVLFEALKSAGVSVDFSGSEFVAEFSAAAAAAALASFAPFAAELDKHPNVALISKIAEVLKDDPSAKFKAVFIFRDEKPASVESVYLKLYLLSLGKAELRSLVLDGAFGVLSNVAWDKDGKPIELEWLCENEIDLKMRGAYPAITSVDKFPRYLSHIIPADNVRVLDTAKVRMGAQLAGGTTIMPGAAYVNFNAGTTGSVMVEGRVSSSVVVGEGSDVGGGASILGVLSGTNGNPVSIGKRCLLGANSVTGIPFGDDCIIDAGIAVLEGTKVHIGEKDREAR